MKPFRTIPLLTVLIIGVYSECSSVPKCTCANGVEIEEQVHSSEILHGAVGALSSAVVTMGGTGLYFLIKSRSPSIPDTDSMVSDTDVEERTRGQKRSGRDNSAFPPPPYSGDAGDTASTPPPFKPPNIYSAGKNDTVNHRVGTNASRNMMTLNDI